MATPNRPQPYVPPQRIHIEDISFGAALKIALAFLVLPFLVMGVVLVVAVFIAIAASAG